MVSLTIIILLFITGFHIIKDSNPMISNASAGSSWIKSTDKDFNNGTLINLTIVGNGQNGKLKIDLSKVTGWTDKSPMTQPSARYNHAMASIIGTDKVVLFGGYNGSDNNAETWIYDVSENSWIQKFPVLFPSARSAHRMVSLDGDDKVVLFGGYGGSWPSETYLNDTWIYDLSENSWVLKLQMPRPVSRAWHSMSTIFGNDRILLYGGYGGSTIYYSDTWIYDVGQNTWTLKSPTNKPTSMYQGAMASVENTDKVIHYGGWTDNMPTEETWIYDVSDETWTQKTPSSRPVAQVGADMATIFETDEVVLFGGSKMGISWLDETWIYNLNDNMWTQQLLKKKPKNGYGHALSSVHGSDKIIHFGGYKGYPVSETWEYKYYLPKMNGTYISNPFDAGDISHFSCINWTFNEPVNTSIKLQFRSAQNYSDLLNKNYVGPNGKPSSFYNKSDDKLWSGHNGSRYIQYRILFGIKNYSKLSPSVSNVQISYNCLPQTIVRKPVNGSLLTINKPTFAWTFFDYDSQVQNAYQVIIDDDINFNSVDYDSGIRKITKQYWEFPSGTSYSEIPDGRWYWKVRTQDSDEFWTEYSPPSEIIIDVHVPTSSIVFPINNGFYNVLHGISGEANDPINGSGLKSVEITIKALDNNTYWNGSQWVPFETWLSTIGKTNWEYNTSTVEWISKAVYQIYSRATDNVTNTEIPMVGTIFTIDMDSPTSKIEAPTNNSWLNTLKSINGNSIDFSGSGVEFVEISLQCTYDYDSTDIGAKKNDFWNGDKWIPNECWLVSNGTSSWYNNITIHAWSTGNQYVIRSRAIDKIGNIETPSSGISFFFDDQAPDPISILINNNDEYTNTNKVVLFLYAEDKGSGISDMSLSSDGIEWSNWKVFNTTHTLTLPATEGNLSMYFRVRDKTGNIAEPVSDSIILDSTPPNNLQIIINNNDKYTNSSSVSLNLLGYDSLSGISEMSISFDPNNWQDWEPFKPSKSVSLPPGDGDKKVFFKLRDKAGNIAVPVFDSIILDTKPPHSLEMHINNGEPKTNSTLVKLKINASDDGSGVDLISFKSDNEPWSVWENYSELKDYSLNPGDGIKTISFNVKDKAGNIAGPQTATILLDSSIQQIDNRPKKEDLDFLGNWQLIFIIIILSLILIIAGLISIYIHNKRTEQKMIMAGILPIKPTEVLGPVKIADQIPAGMESARLPTTTTGREIPIVMAPTNATPQLAKSTQVAPKTTAEQPTLVSQYPQLPPAKESEKIEEIIPGDKQPEVETTPTTTSMPTPISDQSKPEVVTQPTPQPTLQLTLQPTLASEPKTGPEVHLPEESKPEDKKSNDNQQ
jgi:hypothetical protein